MKRNILSAALLAPALIYISACSGDASGAGKSTQSAAGIEDNHEDDDEHGEAGHGHDHDSEEDGSEHNEGDHVELSAAEADAAGIRIGEAQSGRIGGDLELPAEIRFDADRVARISPKVEGVIARLYAGEGDTVSKGATLAFAYKQPARRSQGRFPQRTDGRAFGQGRTGTRGALVRAEDHGRGRRSVSPGCLRRGQCTA